MYSIVARYGFHMGINSKHIISEDLFGFRITGMYPEYVNNITSLPSRINHFCEGYTQNYFLQFHTTAPLYKPFNKQKLNEVSMNSRKFFKDNIKGEYNLNMREELYYCNECLKEQFETLGEGYWDRMCQVSGILICNKHKKPLNQIEININKDLINRLLLPEHYLIEKPIAKISQDTLEKLVEIRTNIEYLFTNDVEHFAESILYNKYLEYIRIKGFATPQIRMKERLTELLLKHFGEDILDKLDSNPQKNNWVSLYFNEKSMHRIHPVRHILLMIILAGSSKNFIEDDPFFKPFGSGPWICMNPLSNHYLKKVITKIKVSLHQGNREHQADFECGCGYIYRLRKGEIDPLLVKYFSNRVMRKGTIWEEEFNKLIRKGETINKIAEKTNLSRSTIRRIIKEGYDPINNGLRKKRIKVQERRIEKTKQYKQIWLDLLGNHPNYTRSDLSKVNRAVYAWLHNHDSEWIKGNSPPSLRGSTKLSKKDYTEKDQQILRKAEAIAEKWTTYERKAGKLIRKTNQVFYIRIGLNLRINANNEKYPLTYEYVNSILESINDFHKRKLNHTLNEYFTGIYVAKYSLTEKAGVRKTMSSEIEMYLEKLIQNHNLDL